MPSPVGDKKLEEKKISEGIKYYILLIKILEAEIIKQREPRKNSQQ